MPRRNNTPKHVPFKIINREANKQRYSSKLAADKAVEIFMLQKPGLSLGVYKGNDGGWYLTSNVTD